MRPDQMGMAQAAPNLQGQPPPVGVPPVGMPPTPAAGAIPLPHGMGPQPPHTQVRSYFDILAERGKVARDGG